MDMQKIPRGILTLILGIFIISVRYIVEDNVSPYILLEILTVLNIITMLYTLVFILNSIMIDLEVKYRENANGFNLASVSNYKRFFKKVIMVFSVLSLAYLYSIHKQYIKSGLYNDIICVVTLCTSIEADLIQEKIISMFVKEVKHHN